MSIILETEFDDFPTGAPGDSFVGSLNSDVTDNVDTMYIILQKNTSYTFSLDNSNMNIRLLTTNYGHVASPVDGSNTFEYTTPDFISDIGVPYMIYVTENEFGNELFNYTVTTSIGSVLIADLVTETTDVSDTFWSDGEEVTIDWAVGNDGAADASSSATTYYISVDDVIDAADTLLFTDNATDVIAAGRGFDDSRTFSVDLAGLGLATGTYWIGGIADSNNVIIESDETNNAGGPVQIEILGPPRKASIDEFADMLTDRYWKANGGTPRAFDEPGNVISVDVTGLTNDGQQLARWAMEAWSAVADISFREVASGRINITFDDERNGANTRTVYDNGVVTSAEINVATKWMERNGTSADSYSLQTFIHELGHALGLGHAGYYNGSATYGVDNNFTNDSWQMTIMSYIDQSENTEISADYGFIAGPMIADIVAIQSLYGEFPVSADTISLGDTTWGANSNLAGYQGKLWRSVFNGEKTSVTVGNPVAFTIYDAGGADTMDFSAAAADEFQLIDMNAEGISSVGGYVGNVVIARNTVIENAIGGRGEDVIEGNNAGNRIDGGSGDDLILGRDGNDVLDGGGGDDDIRGGSGDDILGGGGGRDILNGQNGKDVLNGGSQNDHLLGGSDDDTLSGQSGQDRLEGQDGDDKLSGGAANDLLLGGAGRDVLNGDAGNDRLEGGGGADKLSGGNNADSLLGGAGNDRLRGESGNDQLFGAIGHDALFGGFGDDVLAGGQDNDILIGQSGNDNLDGGTGANKLTGGTGSDIFVFSGGRDVITDFDSAELDQIDLSGNGSIVNFADLKKHHISDVNGNAVIDDLTGNTLILNGIVSASLVAGDFIF